jgi:thiol-disulfide isomerase/thioredoxin
MNQLNSNAQLLLDYWAERRALCKAMAPVLNQVAEEYRDRLKVVKVNVEQEPQIARRVGRAQPAAPDAVQAQHGGSPESRGALQVAAQSLIELNLRDCCLPKLLIFMLATELPAWRKRRSDYSDILTYMLVND